MSFKTVRNAARILLSMISSRVGLLALASVFLATSLACASPPAVGGYWTGQVNTPAGTMPIALTITPSESSALLDAPRVGIVDGPMTLTITGDRIHLVLDIDGAAASAEATAAAAEMLGTVTVGSASYPLALRRGAKPKRNYRTEAVKVRNGDIALAATLYLPEGDRPVPAISFVAGLTPRGNSVHFLADLFATRGVAVLTYDRRGVGASTGEPRASFIQHATDAAAAVRYLRTRREIDPKRIGIRGQSQGAWLAPLAATLAPVSFVIATGGGGVRPCDSEMYAIPARMRADGVSAEEITDTTAYMQKLFDVGRTAAGWDELSTMVSALQSKGSNWIGKHGPVYSSLEQLKRTWNGQFSYDPAPVLGAIQVPYLALMGEKDVYAPPVENQAALERLLRMPDKTVKIIPGATHDFHVLGAPLPLVSQEYLQNIINWTMAHAGIASSHRTVSDHTIVSTEPKLTLAIDSSLRFVGSFGFDVRDAAHAERFIFADVDEKGAIHRLGVVQFESMLPQHAGSYDEPKQKDRVRLGPFEFQQTVGIYNFATSIAAKPGAEAERTRDFLRDKGLSIEGDLLVARFETLTDKQRRQELILFYWEDLTAAGHSRAAIDAAPDDERAAWFRDFSERAKSRFTIRAE